eukprot:3888328-Pyramimonas_sp.AAC.1
MLVEGSDALCLQKVALVQITAQVAHFHGASARAVYLELCYQSPAACSELRRFPPALYLRPQ